MSATESRIIFIIILATLQDKMQRKLSAFSSCSNLLARSQMENMIKNIKQFWNPTPQIICNVATKWCLLVQSWVTLGNLS